MLLEKEREREKERENFRIAFPKKPTYRIWILCLRSAESGPYFRLAEFKDNYEPVFFSS